MQKRSPIRCRPVRKSDTFLLHTRCFPDGTFEETCALVENAQYIAEMRRGLGAVVLWDGQLIGFGLLTLLPTAAEISNLIVAPGWRERGAGTALIHYLARAAAARHASRVELGVTLANVRALALYRRLGFAEVRRLEIDMGAGPETVVYLAKPLQTKRGKIV